MIKVMLLMALEYPPPLPRRRIDTRQADRGHEEHRSRSCSRFVALLESVRETSASDQAKCPPASPLAAPARSHRVAPDVPLIRRLPKLFAAGLDSSVLDSSRSPRLFRGGMTLERSCRQLCHARRSRRRLPVEWSCFVHVRPGWGAWVD